MSGSKSGLVIMSSQKIHNRLREFWINITYLETCKILDFERTIHCDLKSRQMRVTTEVFKPVYKEEKLSIFPALYHCARTKLKSEGKRNPRI